MPLKVLFPYLNRWKRKGEWSHCTISTVGWFNRDRPWATNFEGENVPSSITIIAFFVFNFTCFHISFYLSRSIRGYWSISVKLSKIFELNDLHVYIFWLEANYTCTRYILMEIPNFTLNSKVLKNFVNILLTCHMLPFPRIAYKFPLKFILFIIKAILRFELCEFGLRLM